MFTAKWYNALVRDCNLDPKTFQLMQGSTLLDTTSDALWNIYDAIPPESINQLYSSAPGNNFSSYYGAILKCLDLNDGRVKAAANKWDAAGEYEVKAYDTTRERLQARIVKARGFKIKFDTASESQDLTRTWAKRESPMIPVAPKLLRTLSLAGARALPQALPEGVVEVEFQHLEKLDAGPLSTINRLDTELLKYKPWYDAAALQLAYRDRDQDVWRTKAWSTYFGDAGSMLRRCTSLVIVDGVTSVTPAKSPTAFWPFTMQLGGAEEPVPRKAGDQVIVESKAGNPFILGVEVVPLPEYLGGSPDKPAGSVSVKNSGGFFMRFTVRYQQDGNDKSVVSDTFGIGTAKLVSIPRGAQNVNLVFEAMVVPLPAQWSAFSNIRLDGGANKCYEVSGGTLTPNYKEIPCR